MTSKGMWWLPEHGMGMLHIKWKLVIRVTHWKWVNGIWWSSGNPKKGFFSCWIHFCQPQWFRVMLAVQSRGKAARGRQNCQKISISKYSHVIMSFHRFLNLIWRKFFFLRSVLVTWGNLKVIWWFETQIW